MLRNLSWLNRWSRLSLTYRGAIIVTIPSLCLFGTVGAWFWSRSQGLKVAERIEQVQTRLDLSNELLITLLNAETGVRGFVLKQNPDFLEPFYQAHQSVPQVLQKLVSSVEADTELDYTNRSQLAPLRTQIETIQRLTNELQAASSPSQQAELLRQGKEAMDQLRQTIANFQTYEYALLKQRQTEQKQIRSLIQALQQLAVVSGVLSTAGAIYLFGLLGEELKSRESQLQTRNSLLKTLSNDIVDGIIVIDAAGFVETVNPAVSHMLGYSPTELLECPLIQILVEPTTPLPRPLPPLRSWLEQLPRLGRTWQTQAYRKDGSSIPIELSLSEIPGENQSIAIIRDVSEQISLMQQLQLHLDALERLNQALIRSNSSLERRNQELADFAYATAHDLRTPVRGIVTLSEWIEEELSGYTSEQLLTYLHLLRKRTHRLNALIDGLWEYTNLGQTPVAPEAVQLDAIVEEIQQARPLPEGFDLQLHHPLVTLTTCKVHLKKVLEELLENAVKHHDRSTGQIEIFAHGGEDMIEFMVQDDGPGIPSAYHTRVFRLFETLEPRDLTENTGIGLAIAKKLVERVGGRIWIQSNGERGTTIHFSWPKHPET
ncbi:ATP-binding protein [Alkalinema sp. FACHB-956]|uniref:ATP-binding protein n=1 Tax=Alkalinema sp. FACHB-956 TaxID=2692768 RepID=UPI001683251C|nr:ATP-binding protein [Alkalinema sp. FACHB-956]MBD2328024.1 CHASE3 domain-containing protein [Alkalinema sp. FACHB-956]